MRKRLGASLKIEKKKDESPYHTFLDKFIRFLTNHRYITQYEYLNAYWNLYVIENYVFIVDSMQNNKGEAKENGDLIVKGWGVEGHKINSFFPYNEYGLDWNNCTGYEIVEKFKKAENTQPLHSISFERGHAYVSPLLSQDLKP